ncbi:50S ribosomal protein L11 [Candidatus Woesearchaeota archaeon]|nr:50S ribosomal protein L11 [Candidatus Woesearchaeota archaeon]
MAKQTVEALIAGGKANAAPPLGPALGPTGLNVAEVIKKINEKTIAFNGMQVPVKIIFDASDKTFEITVGTPPVSALLKTEGKLEKGSGSAKLDKVADLRIEQIIKVAKMKGDSLAGINLKKKVKEVIGTCVSMGILVQGMDPKDAMKEVDNGKFDKEIKLEKTELTAEELKHLEEEKIRLAAEAEKRHAAEEALAAQIVKEMEGKATGLIKAKMVESGISKAVIDKTLGTGKAAAAPGAPGAAPAAGAKPAAVPGKK